MVDFLLVRDADPYLTDKGGKNFVQLANEADHSNAVAPHLSKFLTHSSPSQLGNMGKNQPVALRKHSATASPSTSRVPLSNPPINPPRRRNSKLEQSPMNLRGGSGSPSPSSPSMMITEQRNSQISTASSHSSSSSSAGMTSHPSQSQSQPPAKPTSEKPSLYASNCSSIREVEQQNSEDGVGHQVSASALATRDKDKDIYTRQLEAKNAELMREQLEMQKKLEVMMKEQRRERDQQQIVGGETNEKVSRLEETVRQLMTSLDQQQQQKSQSRETSLPSSASYNMQCSPPDTFQPKHMIAHSQSMGLLRTATDHGMTSGSSTEASPEKRSGNNGDQQMPPPPPPQLLSSTQHSGFQNYFNMSSVGLPVDRGGALDRQRNSQSSDSGYSAAGISPTSSTRGGITAARNLLSQPHLNQMTNREMRAELETATQCLKELTHQQSKMQQALDVQARAISSVSATVQALHEALHRPQSTNGHVTCIAHLPSSGQHPPHTPPVLPPLSSASLGSPQQVQSSQSGRKLTNRVSMFEKHV
ncbi:uncharacterized protein LOC134854071 [Symsagittifera roscoffensis]|uniref:uncharacterized protein LOC134854071 n=1 Tax=Symsagittifera roscoffensis TaxID=84072 RepID=UPI00307BAFD0